MGLDSRQLLHNSEMNVVITEITHTLRAYCSERESGEVVLTVNYFKLGMGVR